MSIVFPPLYAIIDADILKTSELSFAEKMAESGVELLQVRAKHASSRQLFESSRRLCARFADFATGSHRAVRLIVNDRPDVAMLAGAGGVHVGQNDLSVEQARAIVGAHCWVGVSTHNLEQLEAADKTSADYIAFGPIFPTDHEGTPRPRRRIATASSGSRAHAQTAGGYRRHYPRTRRGHLSSRSRFARGGS